MINVFNRWESDKIKVNDAGLVEVINLKPVLVPKTGGRNTEVKFWKNKYNIVERLINHVMIPGHKGKKHKLTSGRCSGKGVKAYNIILRTFEILEKKTTKNPIEVLVRAIENAAPREEITSIEYGGARYSQSVDCSPQRRVDLVLRMFIQGAYHSRFGKKLSFEDALANEILFAYNTDQKSNAISRKLELERQAESSR